jgi:hypothetical protein
MKGTLVTNVTLEIIGVLFNFVIKGVAITLQTTVIDTRMLRFHVQRAVVVGY